MLEVRVVMTFGEGDNVWRGHKRNLGAGDTLFSRGLFTCVRFGEDSSVYLGYLHFIICLLHISKKVF